MFLKKLHNVVAAGFICFLGFNAFAVNASSDYEEGFETFASRTGLVPNELIRYIMSEFDTQSLANCRQVCKNLRDNAEAEIRKRVGDSDAQALEWCCFAYANGNQAVKDIVEKAAYYGHALAQHTLGRCYKNGKGVKRDFREAVKWWQKAADQGNAGAQNNLGMCYYKGEGVEKDLREAVKWVRRAADQGHAFAQCRLGVCYEIGKGVDKDIDIAVQLYTEAAKQGETYSQKRLKRLGQTW